MAHLLRLHRTLQFRKFTLVYNSDALNVSGLNVKYGVIQAVHGMDLAVKEGTITALVGSNGAGKSSALRAMAGIIKSEPGTVTVHGEDISSLSTRDRIIEHGVVLIPEGRSVFTTMSVADNLHLGARVGNERSKQGHISTFSTEEAYELFPVLKDRQNSRAQTLSGGEQQMLAIARSLLMSPKVLLIDEPSMGLAPLLVRKIFGVMKDVFARNSVSVLLVEQDTSIALELASDAYLLEHGNVIAHAPSAEMRNDARLREAYLGKGDALGQSHGTGKA